MSYEFKEEIPVVNTTTGESDLISVYLEVINENYTNINVQINNYIYVNSTDERLVPEGVEQSTFRMLNEPYHTYRRSIN